jgi:type VI protein secretion system component VasK
MHLGYTLRRLPGPGIDEAALVINGQSLTEVGRSQQFTWQGGESSVALNVTAAGQKLPGPAAQGPWALFEFLDSADTWTGNNPAILAWQLRVQFGRRTVGEGQKTEVQYELTTQGAQVFKKEFLAGLHCSAR